MIKADLLYLPKLNKNINVEEIKLEAKLIK